jgi:hypothetical protein
MLRAVVLAAIQLASLTHAFVLPGTGSLSRLGGGAHRLRGGLRGGNAVAMSSATPQGARVARLHEPSTREGYGSNMAQYLVDLHDSRSVFDFCGGMLFQLSLTDALRSHLSAVSGGSGEGQLVVCDAATDRMAKMAGYDRSAFADNRRLFHGREIRQVPAAEGGMGFVLQLSLAEGGDPEGWTAQEIAGYDGWGHDAGRVWRDGARLEREGFTAFRTKYGDKAFTLNHRFYLHLDADNRLWLSAEDGCEGTPASTRV